MALSDRAAAVAPYAQQLFNDKAVRASARQAANATRAAYRRARGQRARESLKDRTLRRRAGAAAAALGELLSAVSEAAPKRKSRWPRRIALLGIAAGAVVLITNDDVRARVGQLAGRKNADDSNPS